MLILADAVEAYNLRKIYPQPRNFFEMFTKKRNNEVLALDGVSLKVKKGECFGVLGPNGAGKTTLTKILCTLILPSEGTAMVNGYDVLKEGSKLRSSVGLVSSDERSFYWKLSGRQNLMFFALLHDFKRREARKRVEEVLEEVGLKEKADSRFETYSSGMKQTMSIARGLLNDPEILFMDEPTRSLDPNAAREIRNLILKEAGKGKTIFLTTHNLHEAELLCDRVMILHKGKVRGLGSVKDLEKMFKHGKRITLEVQGFNGIKISSLKKFKAIESLEEFRVSDKIYRLNIETSEDSTSEILETIINLGGKITAIKTKETNLEQIFEKLTKGGITVD